MKAAVAIVFLLLALSAMSWLSAPVAVLSMPEFVYEMSWVGMELGGFLALILVFFAVVALLSIGILGVGLVVLIGLVLALLFGSVVIALPLCLLIIFAWLISDEWSLC
ncbi:hypothetical protein N474_07310 [Pseudoalteromonas luteoviolacea CPMOR-2]|uniref:Uncharacterized protein n=1 Tax=Pseudoalteromonas luteoviolacea DSM 6061 TaxID=1365250 RepID=A0A166WDA4_9GAMM|nr:hypothetical protein [Pseudoalteromonas luteoviolacea]KZN37253.1 hypothetical protein N475_16290 [Pseudoalteromonas luteoviolacea DSM 6061]KZN59495.1 hypothetical protein N474_07310 [Pseudoalteromonas luteoviolacea CPMOR-2]MBE0387526.1 hypothetical protein [Pseudoalteromonas luteoviolacea DSM 6061]